MNYVNNIVSDRSSFETILTALYRDEGFKQLDTSQEIYYIVNYIVLKSSPQNLHLTSLE